MSKLTLFQSYHLKGIAKSLPIVLDNTHEKHLVKGSDILAWGTVTEIEGQPIDPDRDYLWHYPVQMYRNHYRRLKKAYLASQMDGVYRYLAELDRTLKEAKQGNSLAAFLALQQFLTTDSNEKVPA